MAICRGAARRGRCLLSEVDNRRRTALPKAPSTTCRRYPPAPGDAITLAPAVVRSALKDALRHRRGYIEQLEGDAADSTSSGAVQRLRKSMLRSIDLGPRWRWPMSDMSLQRRNPNSPRPAYLRRRLLGPRHLITPRGGTLRSR